MTPIALALLVSIALSSSVAFAGFNPSFNMTGNYGVEVTGVAGGNTSVAFGTLTLSNLPIGAVIQRATLYASQTNNQTGLDAIFAGNNLGTTAPSAADTALLTMYTYQWDVTTQIVSGINSYSFTIGQSTIGAAPIAGVALSVVWSHPAEPTRTVVLFDGMQQVGESGPETESLSLGNLPGGSTTLWLFTVNDDNSSTGETINYNGSAIGGPIDRNLGFDASLFSLSATSSSTVDVLSITTGNDHMGWMVAAAAADFPPVPVIEDSWGKIKALYE